MGTLHCLHTRTQKKSFLGFRFADIAPASYTDVSLETEKAQEYVVTATAEAHAPVAVPHNLPTVGYDGLFGGEEEVVATEDEERLNELENQAHEHKVLLSSDAMRYFVGRIHSHNEQKEILDTVIEKARGVFPNEEGWIVLNLSRMEEVLDEVLESKVQPTLTEGTTLEESISFVPMTAGSLAEAIVTKNVIAAYDMIAERPMIALADVTSDLNNVYRARKGESVTVSNLLAAYTRELSNDKLESLTLALTSALDGTYTTEEEAVKMAIVKAIEVLN